PVTDEVKREGGVNADASASVRLLVGTEVVATSVERTAPGDWGVLAERVGEDRLIEVAGLIADDMFSEKAVKTVYEVGPAPVTKQETNPVKPARKSAAPNRGQNRGAKPGMSFMEVA